MVNRDVEVGEVVGSDKQNSDTSNRKRSAYLVSNVLGGKTEMTSRNLSLTVAVGALS